MNEIVLSIAPGVTLRVVRVLSDYTVEFLFRSIVRVSFALSAADVLAILAAFAGGATSLQREITGGNSLTVTLTGGVAEVDVRGGDDTQIAGFTLSSTGFADLLAFFSEA